MAALTASVPITLFGGMRQQLLSGVTEAASAISQALAELPGFCHDA